MKKSLLALALFASAATAFAHDGDKPAAKGKKADHCSAAAAAKCSTGMTASAKMDGMPACCRAKMSAMKSAMPATAATKAVVKSM
ncbi:hypothetical protein [Hymenobacter bucti]|uniref:Uncharacterized protein n=1 Tax=Hymenobacter bucti TaxID=1844114 RepID=A0ABW4QSN1_9BACT